MSPIASDGREGGEAFVIVGRIAGLHGVTGGLKVYSYTRPVAAIFEYAPWYLARADGWQPVVCSHAAQAHKRLIAHLEGYADRDSATGLVGADIAVRRAQLGSLRDGEHYWADLIGLTAYTPAGRYLGSVSGLLETAAHDVLIVQGERERLIPFVAGVYVLSVDMANGRLVLDWDPDD